HYCNCRQRWNGFGESAAAAGRRAGTAQRRVVSLGERAARTGGEDSEAERTIGPRKNRPRRQSPASQNDGATIRGNGTTGGRVRTRIGARKNQARRRKDLDCQIRKAQSRKGRQAC